MKKNLRFIALISSVVLIIGGCGTKTVTEGSSTTNTPIESKAPASIAPVASIAPTVAPTEAPTATPIPVKKVLVGTSPDFPNVTFIDKDNKLTGYDIELVREIDKRLPEYEFEFQTADFSSLLLNLETKKIDLIANQMEKNPDREKKFLFNKESYAYWKTKIEVAKDNETVKSIDDLKGKKVLVSATSAEAAIIENYNKTSDKKIKIVYQSGAANDTVNQLTKGRVDASIGADFVLPVIDPEGKLKLVGPILTESKVLFVFRKDEPEEQILADKIDEVIKALKSDGTLTKLSLQWLKVDITKLED